jgi:hypothetical protein
LPFAGSAVATSRGEAVSYFIHTDNENELRDRAWRFLMPAHERAFFQLQVAELSRTRVLPRTAKLWGDESYFNALRWSRGASPAPLFRRIGEDAAADRELIPAFVSLAERVLASDAVRLKLLVHVGDLDEAQVENAVARVVENRCLVAWVYAEAQGRAQRYRYALERLAIEAPQAEAAHAEREIIALEADVSLFEILGIASLRNQRCEPGGFIHEVPAAAVQAAPGVGPVVEK